MAIDAGQFSKSSNGGQIPMCGIQTSYYHEAEAQAARYGIATVFRSYAFAMLQY